MSPRFLALTGSIGMGKTTIAAMFRQRGIPVHDSDAVVHALYSGDVAPEVEATFPGVVFNGVVDRRALSLRVLDRPEDMRRLEAIVHPRVRDAETAFRRTQIAVGHRFVVCDIPLLFETGGESRFDAVIVVSAPAQIQRARVLAREGMTAARFEAILSRQTPDAEKRRKAHFVVQNGNDLAGAARQVDDIVRALAAR